MLINNSVSDAVKREMAKKISRKQAILKIGGIALGASLAGLIVKGALADTVFRAKDGAGIVEYLIVRSADGTTILGKAGDTIIGTAVPSDFYSKVAGGVNIGKVGNEFGDMFLTGTGRMGALQIDQAPVAASTGVLTILTGSANNANSDGLAKMNFDGTDRYFPFLNNPTP